MDLDDQYNPAHKQAQFLQNQFHDYVGRQEMHYDPRATLLQHEIHHLVGELESHKDPRSIENRIEIIQRQIRENQLHSDPIMHYDHLNEMHAHFDQMRQQVRRFTNYN